MIIKFLLLLLPFFFFFCSEYIIDLMGAPGTLIPAEAPSGHLQNFGLDARAIATVAGVGKSSLIAPDQGARIILSSPSLDETANTRSLSSDLSSIVTQPRRNCRIIAGKVQTNQLEHDTGHISSRGVFEASLLAGIKTTGGESNIEDVSMYSNDAGKKPEFSTELSTMLFDKLAPALELADISSHEVREGEVLESNRTMSGESGVYQCHPEISLPKDELSHVNNNLHDSCRKRSVNRLSGHQSETAGHTPSFDSKGKQNMLVKDRMDEVIRNYGAAVGNKLVDFSGNREAMEMACDMQSDSVLNGVAEILWEDLQIGERIGIGKTPIIRLCPTMKILNSL